MNHCMNHCNPHSNMQSGQIPADRGCVKMPDDLFEGRSLAMGYVPVQHFNQMFALEKGLRMGTIFPELCLPFCGVRRNCSCKTTR